MVLFLVSAAPGLTRASLDLRQTKLHAIPEGVRKTNAPNEVGADVALQQRARERHRELPTPRQFLVRGR
jgi:hypothetical protein